MADVVARGVRFHVQRLGAGERTVVFIHGLVLDNLSSWYFTVAGALARHASLVLYDLRGHGKSEQPKSGYSVGDMVADLAALLEALGLGGRRISLAGNSFGGTVALAFALAHPERVADLVLVDAHVGDTGWGDRMAETLHLQGEERDRKVEELFRSWVDRHSDGGRLSRDAQDIVGEIERNRTRRRNRVEELADSLVYRTSFVQEIRGSPAPSDEDLRRIKCPVLALFGESSDVRTDGERLASLLPCCQLHILPGCTHSVLWQATDRVRDRLVDWITGRTRGDGG